MINDMILKLVIDSELFKLYSQDIHNNLFVNDDEKISFLELLRIIVNGNAIICLNDEILEEYLLYIKTAPDDIKYICYRIFSDARCTMKIASTMNSKMRQYFSDTSLKTKTKYLDVAYFLEKKIILSTREDKKRIYEPNENKLLRLGIHVEDIFSLKGLIKENAKEMIGEKTSDFEKNKAEVTELIDEKINSLKENSTGISTFIASDCWTLSDELGHDAYAYAVYKFLIHKDTKPPLTISIQAPWGGGKTSLMRMIQNNLDPKALEKYIEYKEGSFNGKRDEKITGKTSINLNSWLAVYYGHISSLFNQRNEKKSISSFSASDIIFDNNLVKRKNGAIPKEKLKVIPPQNKLTVEQACNELSAFTHGMKPKFEIPGFDENDQRLTIWFNVWKYENTEQVWAGLADAIIRQFGERLEPVKREIFWLYLHYRRLDPDKVRNTIYMHILTEFLHNMRFWFLGALSMLIILFYLFITKISSLFIPITSLSIISTLIIKGFFQYQDVKKTPAEISISKYLRVPDYNAKLGFVHFAEEDLKYVLEDLITKPIVIFIDDLDRCSPDKVADLTGAINLFLAGEFKNCIFVLGMDPEIVAASLEEAHSKMISKLPSGAKNTPIGWRFMDKFVQLPLVIPLADKDSLDNYVRSLLSDYIGIEKIDEKVKNDINEELPKVEDFTQIGALVKKYTEKYNLNEDQQLCINHVLTQNVRFKKVDYGVASFSDKNSEILSLVKGVAPEFSRNPRDLKRFFNIFRFLYFLKWAREEDGKPSLSLEQLCRWIVLSMKWPEVERWLRYSYGRQEGWAQEEKEISTSTNRLQQLETIGARSKNLDDWLSEIKDKLKLTVENNPWIADDDLRKFFQREGSFEAKDRLSNASGMGLW